MNTAMNMGELLNSIGGSEVSDTVFVQPDGTIKMSTIKPQLGKGLGECGDINRGKIFPSLKSNSGRDLDNMFACDPILITNKKINKKELRIKSYECSDIPGIEIILKKFKTNTLIIRPDRFILASTKKNDLLKYTNSCLKQIYNS